MKVLLVHPSALLYSEVYLRLEPLGLECVGHALKRAGHDVRLLDLQIFSHRDFEHELKSFQPDAIGFSLNYLANVTSCRRSRSSIGRRRTRWTPR
jgi:magnesium-protoporphyrin IX monomethyl ester (oxidative) cyclase